jgi:hypothetical protein
MVSAAQMDAGCYGNGGEEEVAHTKVFYWIYLGVNVSIEDDGAFKLEVLFADTQNRMEPGGADAAGTSSVQLLAMIQCTSIANI